MNSLLNKAPLQSDYLLPLSVSTHSGLILTVREGKLPLNKQIFPYSIHIQKTQLTYVLMEILFLRDTLECIFRFS